MNYQECRGYASKLSPTVVMSTVAEAKRFDIDKAKSIIAASSRNSLQDAIDMAASQHDLRAAIIFLVEIMKSSAEEAAS